MSSMPTWEPENDLGKTVTSAVNVDSSSAAAKSPIKSANAQHYLVAPFTPPVRPLSPDTLSHLSFDEFEQLQPSRSASLAYAIPQRQHSSWMAKLNAFWVKNKGLFLMLVAQWFGTLMNVVTRLLEVEGNKGKGMHPFQILFARMSITVALSTLWMYRNKTPHFPFGMPEVRKLLFLRGFGGFFGVFGMYYSLQYLPLADATVITFLAPSLACWACSILINEPFTRVEQIAAMVSLAGVVLIARPASLLTVFGTSNPSDSSSNDSGTIVPSNDTIIARPDASNYDDVLPMERLKAVGFALIGVLGAASAYTTIRWIGKRAHPLISVNYFATWCTFISIVMMLVLPDVGFILPATAKEWGYLIALGACGFIMQFLLAASLSYEKSSRATNIVYTQMLFALGFDKLIFDHSPGLTSIFGSSLILGSAIVVTLQGGGRKNEPGPAANLSTTDVESQQTLLNHTDAIHDAEPVSSEGIQLRALR